MRKSDNDPKSEIKKLTAERNSLFKEFQAAPGKISFALKIKEIDDEIARLQSARQEVPEGLK
jgi:hypothetical protein